MEPSEVLGQAREHGWGVWLLLCGGMRQQLQKVSWRVMQKGGSGGVINEGTSCWKISQTDHIQSSGEVNMPAGILALTLVREYPP